VQRLLDVTHPHDSKPAAQPDIILHDGGGFDDELLDVNAQALLADDESVFDEEAASMDAEHDPLVSESAIQDVIGVLGEAPGPSKRKARRARAMHSRKPRLATAVKG